MFCPNCGTEIKEKKTFCPKCGSPLGVEAVQEDTKTVEAAASTENVHENVIPPQGAPVPSKKGGKKKFIIVNCTPFVRQYGILSNKWGVLLCQREYRTNDTQRNSRSW